MADTAIRIRNLSKSYTIGQDTGHKATNLAEATMQVLRKPFQKTKTESFWALKDVDLDIEKGEVVGIIGRNGAGKSTLLKILSRITEPTTGRIELFGRVGSLLEVGTGFHSELSGRENIYLNGAILGMRRSEISRQFDAIVDFSGVEKFLDTPVKRYSSGMYVRLAFAVAAHLNPEILVVDEVLAVGDVEFQKKCIGKMSEVARSGRTVLFVSHNTQAITTLCDSAVLLCGGTVAMQGASADVIAAYLADGSDGTKIRWEGRDGDDDLALLSSELIGDSISGVFLTHEAVQVRILFEVRRPIIGVVCAVEMFNQLGTRLVYSCYDDAQASQAPEVASGTYCWQLTIPPNCLAAGLFRFDFDLGIHNVRRVSSVSSSLTMRMENLHGLGRRFQSHVDVLRPNWTWTPINLDSNAL